MYKEVAKYIENNSSLVLGTTLFINGYIQDSPARCISLYNNAGGEPSYYLYDINFKNEIIQFISRDKSWENSYDDIKIIYELFRSLCGVALPIIESGTAWFIDSSHPTGEPVFIGEDEKRRKMQSLNIRYNVSKIL